MTAGAGSLPVRGPLRHRAFRGLAGGRSATHLANSMAPVLLAFAVLDLTGSAADAGLVIGGRSVANVVLLLFGGVLADRLPKRLLLQGSSLAAGAVQAGAAVTLLTGNGSLTVLLLLSVVNGVVAAVAMPAAASLLPQTVPDHELQLANAVARMGVNSGVIAGTSLGGMLSATLGPGWGMAINGVAFLAAAVAYRSVRVPDRAAAAAGAVQPLRELRAGWREFTAHRWVWVVVAQFFVVNAVTAGGIQVLGPVVANSAYGRTVWGVVLATQLVGALVGGFLVGRSRTRHALRVGVAVVALDALPLLALAGAAPLVLLFAAMFVNGLALERFGVAWELSLQENIAADRLARVYSYDMLGSVLALPLGEMLAGVLSERFGSRPVLLCGVCLVVVATAAALCSREVRELTTSSGRQAQRPPHGDPDTAPDTA